MARGETCIGASSLSFDLARAVYREWIVLPYVNDRNFDRALGDAIRCRHIEKIYSPHREINHYLRAALPRVAPSVSLSGWPPAPIADSQSMLFPMWQADYDSLWGALSPPGIARDGALHPNELKAIIANALRIDGNSHVTKLAAICAIAGFAPRGDVVEIGVLRGRSAFCLGWLARRYGIGSTLCIDPWDTLLAVQHDASHLVTNVLREEIALEDAYEDFLMAIVPCFFQDLNYLRTTSDQACHTYAPGTLVRTPEFGETTYSGRISILHIDANHDYLSVKQDTKLWTPMLVPGGWLVLDDYQWPWGDGPKRAGDEFLEENRGNIDAAFFAGGALFTRMSSSDRMKD